MPDEESAADDSADRAVALSDSIAQQEQMLSSSVQFGRIVEPEDTDPKPPTEYPAVLVHIGGEKKGTFTRNWMQWTVARSGYDAHWWQPEIDEQVVVMAPSGNLALGVIVGVLPRGKWLSFPEANDFSAAPAAPNAVPAEDKAHVHQVNYKDGTAISYDRDLHALDLAVREKAEEDPGVVVGITLKEKKGGVVIQLEAGEPKLTVELSNEKGIKLTLGENFIELNEDTIKLTSKKLEIDAAEGFSVKSAKFNVDDSTEIDATGGKITLKAGTTMEISSGGADVK
ncbi:phage baseplate assembly protein V [Teredinibacter purpureus]|uniref:phage baseplate assembly protein V n=1 Tax=Teredinibacter purpureus TaxID=2731756 RepID=UPI0005F7A104|nr:phage baseplate assembly protein V [Teredinibacter purpureus]